MKVYTKTGDKGTTSTYTGERRSKGDDLFECLGQIDKMIVMISDTVLTIKRENSFVISVQNSTFFDYLNIIQQTLFKVQSILATTQPEKVENFHLKKLSLSEDYVKTLEEYIDIMTNQMPKLSSFIVPTGEHESVIKIHLLRVQTREVERELWKYEGEVPDEVAKYINRLSDFFFTQARFFNHLLKVPDTPVTIN